MRILASTQEADSLQSSTLFNSTGSRILLAAFLIHYICNIASFIVYKKYISVDIDYKQWLESKTNRVSALIIRMLALISTHKFTRILYSRYFGFSFFKAKMSSTDVLLPLNIIAGLANIFVSVPIIAGAGIIAYYD